FKGTFSFFLHISNGGKKVHSFHKGITKVCSIQLFAKHCSMFIHLIATSLVPIVVMQRLKTINWYECLTPISAHQPSWSWSTIRSVHSCSALSLAVLEQKLQ